MEFTVEELAIYGLIDADTYIRLTEAIIAGTADAYAFRLTLSAQVRRRIRQHAETLWRQQRQAASSEPATAPARARGLGWATAVIQAASRC
jgi:hypothetical protein